MQFQAPEVLEVSGLELLVDMLEESEALPEFFSRYLSASLQKYPTPSFPHPLPPPPSLSVCVCVCVYHVRIHSTVSRGRLLTRLQHMAPCAARAVLPIDPNARGI